MSDFATFEDVMTLTGKAYGEAERERIAALLPLVSDALRFEAQKVGKDLDAMADGSASYTNVVKLVTVDIVARVLRQSQNGEPLTQESQSALGYTWSGTYAIPGGGIAGAIMKNDLKRLGLRRQQYGVMYLWDESQDAE
jgi:hypothetical protein